MASRATSPGPKPSLLVFWFFCCFLSFPFFVFNRKTCFPLWKGHFLFIIECLPLFLLSLFGLPLFHFLFLCLSLFLFFLPSCLSFLLSFGSLFSSLYFFVFLLCFCFTKGTTSKYSITIFSSILSHFCWFPLFLFLSNPLSLSLLAFFLILTFVFLLNINVFP